VIEQRSPAAYIAEFLGTFVLVLAITLSVTLFVNSQGTGSDWVVVGLVHFLVLFMLVQTIGSVSGAHLNPAVTLSLADQQNVGAPALNHSLLGTTAAGLVAEGIGTFLLVWTVVAVAVNPRAARDWAGLAIGGVLGLQVMIIGPLTGGSVNPARWFGPALVGTQWDDFWLYILGPLGGGVLAAVLYWYLFVEGPGVRAATPETGPKGLRQDVNPPR
jgi:glycerol uptake facilitator protein